MCVIRLIYTSFMLARRNRLRPRSSAKLDPGESPPDAGRSWHFSHWINITFNRERKKKPNICLIIIIIMDRPHVCARPPAARSCTHAPACARRRMRRRGRSSVCMYI